RSRGRVPHDLDAIAIGPSCPVVVQLEFPVGLSVWRIKNIVRGHAPARRGILDPDPRMHSRGRELVSGVPRRAVDVPKYIVRPGVVYIRCRDSAGAPLDVDVDVDVTTPPIAIYGCKSLRSRAPEQGGTDR